MDDAAEQARSCRLDTTLDNIEKDEHGNLQDIDIDMDLEGDPACKALVADRLGIEDY